MSPCSVIAAVAVTLILLADETLSFSSVTALTAETLILADDATLSLASVDAKAPAIPEPFNAANGASANASWPNISQSSLFE